MALVPHLIGSQIGLVLGYNQQAVDTMYGSLLLFIYKTTEFLSCLFTQILGTLTVWAM